MTGQAPRYRWFMSALVDIAKTEGFKGLYTGVGANVGRASTLAAGEVYHPPPRARQNRKSIDRCRLGT